MKIEMAKYILILALFINTNSWGQKLIDQAQITQSIHNVVKQQETDWNAGNIPGFMEGYWRSDSLTFIGSKGLTMGWQKTLDNYKKSYPDKATMGKLSLEIIKLDILSTEAAIMIGRFTLLREKDKPTGLFTLIWKKIDGKWLITSDQTCG